MQYYNAILQCKITMQYFSFINTFLRVLKSAENICISKPCDGRIYYTQHPRHFSHTLHSWSSQHIYAMDIASERKFNIRIPYGQVCVQLMAFYTKSIKGEGNLRSVPTWIPLTLV